MKLSDLKNINESSTEDKTPDEAPEPTEEEVTGAQAAHILGVSMSRVRQFAADGRLKRSSEPEPGSRDARYKLKDVNALKEKDRPITGRPDGSKEGK